MPVAWVRLLCGFSMISSTSRAAWRVQLVQQAGRVITWTAGSEMYSAIAAMFPVYRCVMRPAGTRDVFAGLHVERGRNLQEF
jgi:hypothetical protein